MMRPALMTALIGLPLMFAGDQQKSVAVYEGRTPCGAAANAFTGFPAQNCEKIKWELTLYFEGSQLEPVRYVYRGTRTTHGGAVSVRRGAPWSADAVIYDLHYGTRQVLSFLSVDRKVLLLLDTDGTVLAGDASWSYALNRTNKTPRSR